MNQPLRAAAWAAADQVADTRADEDFRTLVVDDCRLRRDWVSQFLAMNAVGVSHAWSAESLCHEFERLQPDVILINTATHNAEQLMLRSIELASASNVVAFGLSDEKDADVVWCIEAGVGGYHLRSESHDDLLNVLRKVSRGESACSDRVSAILLRRVSELASQRTMTNESILTAREEEVLQMIALGLPNREIAQRLCIAVHTVKNHVHNLLSKLGARSRAEAVAIYRDTQHSLMREVEGLQADLRLARA